MSNETTRVLVVGAGPVGMVCALALNRRGIPVTVLESEPAPVQDQRAATIHPSTLEMLDDLGITEKIRAHSLLSSTYRFHDRPTGEVVAEFDLGRLKDEVRFPYVLQYEQYKLTAAIAEEYANESDFDVRFSHTLTGLTETASGIEVEYTSPAGTERMAAAYVVGCDGGRSTVRKFAGIEFEGFTYPERFIKIATSFDLKTVKPDLAFRNYFSDPNEWANVFKVRGETPDGLWRVILPIGHDEDDATALSPARVEQRLQKFLPKTGSYDVEYRNVYPVNQRVAATFRQGRILLAGDSAHVNNPIGGMGMNGGIHDAINLTEKLAKVIAGEGGDDLLDLYSRQRRHAAVNYVQAQTIANKRLLEERDPEVRRHNFDELRRTAEKFDTARAYMRRAALFDSLQDAAAIT
ncbi:FAD-dependent oxidoreductase [Streptomyces sp. NPDC050988]|uniref:FAD-dependent oxidoreductase n=1 Tax=Streptomyces sp. NPDC050988 TaxID=3365637 RepID=UPI0037B91BD3